MAKISCEDFRELSGEWMDGERHPDAASHLTACSHCRALIADLETIRELGAALPEEKPPARVWTAIRVRLEEEGLIRSRQASWWERLVSVRTLRPALAGVYLALLVVVSVFFGWQSNRGHRLDEQAMWLSSTKNTVAPLEAEFTAAETKSALTVQPRNSDVTTTLNRNLAIVDNMISMCEKSVREDPQNEMTRDYLYTAYQQKADLLATMAESGAGGR